MNETPAFSDYIRTDDVLLTLYGQFGQVVLLPIPEGTNAPVNAEWKTLTFVETQALPHLRKLSQSSIAVACGKASGQLCGIRFPNQEALNRFIDENPKLAVTLVVKGPSGLVLLVKILGFCPRTLDLATCAWLSDGTCVIVHERDLAAEPCEFSGGSKPVETAFSEIKLDHVAETALLPQIIEADYGPCMFRDRRGRNYLNQNFWAAYYSRQNGLRYHAGRRQFVKCDPKSGLWQPVCNEHILNGLRRLLLHFGKGSGLTVYERSINEKELRKILQHIKIVAVGDFDDDLGALPKFLDLRVEWRQGADVTSEELFLAYGCFCQNERLPSLTRHEFLKMLPAAMREKFGISPSHDLSREDGARRGYVNVSLRQLEEVERSEQRTARTARTG